MVIVEALHKLLALNGPLCHANSDMLEALVPFKGIKVMTSSKILQTTEKGALIESDGKETELEADSVILAVGYNSEKSLYKVLEQEIADIHLLGDARNVANIMYAIWDAYEVASTI